jgi:hypothetical protein
MKKYLKIISLGSILLLFFATSFMACEKNDESNPPGNNNNQFEGNIIIVGCGSFWIGSRKKNWKKMGLVIKYWKRLINLVEEFKKMKILLIFLSI